MYGCVLAVFLGLVRSWTRTYAENEECTQGCSPLVLEWASQHASLQAFVLSLLLSLSGTSKRWAWLKSCSIWCLSWNTFKGGSLFEVLHSLGCCTLKKRCMGIGETSVLIQYNGFGCVKLGSWKHWEQEREQGFTGQEESHLEENKHWSQSWKLFLIFTIKTALQQRRSLHLSRTRHPVLQQLITLYAWTAMYSYNHMVAILGVWCRYVKSHSFTRFCNCVFHSLESVFCSLSILWCGSSGGDHPPTTRI